MERVSGKSEWKEQKERAEITKCTREQVRTERGKRKKRGKGSTLANNLTPSLILGPKQCASCMSLIVIFLYGLMVWLLM
jgi:hypothetical protein